MWEAAQSTARARVVPDGTLKWWGVEHEHIAEGSLDVAEIDVSFDSFVNELFERKLANESPVICLQAAESVGYVEGAENRTAPQLDGAD